MFGKLEIVKYETIRSLNYKNADNYRSQFPLQIITRNNNVVLCDITFYPQTIMTIEFMHFKDPHDYYYHTGRVPGFGFDPKTGRIVVTLEPDTIESFRYVESSDRIVVILEPDTIESFRYVESSDRIAVSDPRLGYAVLDTIHISHRSSLILQNNDDVPRNNSMQNTTIFEQPSIYFPSINPQNHQPSYSYGNYENGNTNIRPLISIIDQVPENTNKPTFQFYRFKKKYLIWKKIISTVFANGWIYTMVTYLNLTRFIKIKCQQAQVLHVMSIIKYALNGFSEKSILIKTHSHFVDINMEHSFWNSVENIKNL